MSQMSNDYIEVDWYVCGVYRGRHKVGKNSIIGALLSGNDASRQISEMAHELRQLGCEVNIQISGGERQNESLGL